MLVGLRRAQGGDDGKETDFGVRCPGFGPFGVTAGPEGLLRQEPPKEEEEVAEEEQQLIIELNSKTQLKKKLFTDIHTVPLPLQARMRRRTKALDLVFIDRFQQRRAPRFPSISRFHDFHPSLSPIANNL